MSHRSFPTLLALLCGACAAPPPAPEPAPPLSTVPRLLVALPEEFNTPDGVALADDGSFFLSVPNFNNDHLLESGAIETAPPPAILKVSADGGVEPWYVFGESDAHPDSGRVGPMGIALGPDGHLYVADMQALWGADHRSRVLRLSVGDDPPVVETVVTGLIAANGLAWHGDRLFVSDSILLATPPPAEGEPRPALVSGVYAFELGELREGPVAVAPWAEGAADEHLVVRLESGNTLGFGADGVTVDDAGQLYTSVVEEGVVYRTAMGPGGEPGETVRFASDPAMKSADGIAWDPTDGTLYVADLLSNAVHAVDPDGSVRTLHRNGDTDGADGSLDEPVEVRVRGDELIVVNMDIAWLTPPGMAVNTAVDRPYTVSVISLR